MTMQIAYVANHGVDLSGSQNVNLPLNYGGGAASQPEYNCNGCGPFHRTAATNEYFLGFSSNFQSLQLQLTRRLSHGLASNSAFTWGKAPNYISDDDGGLLFYINQRRNYAPADDDSALSFEQSFTYQLPFGKGKSRLSWVWE
jgi:hypothetical protein